MEKTMEYKDDSIINYIQKPWNNSKEPGKETES